MSSIDGHNFKRKHLIGETEFAYYSLVACADAYKIDLKRLPVSIKILLENVIRNASKQLDAVESIRAFKRWQENSAHTEYAIAYQPARVLMQDFTGVPSIVDLACMRDAVKDYKGDATQINPHCQVDLVIDHSVQIDVFGSKDALQENMRIEQERNKERYSFLKWGQKAFKNHRLVPPGHGICHQVNLEYLAKVVWKKQEGDGCLVYPDTLVGTDSHTTMVNALGVLGWGVGGIEAEAAMLGQAIELLIPDVVGVCLYGNLNDAVTATDLVLTITEKLRRHGVVGKFVEFYGPGVSCLTLAERATIANMAPEYGATCGFFAVDEETLRYLRLTGREDEDVDLVAVYAREQGLWHDPHMLKGVFSSYVEIDLSDIEACLAGPKRPQDRVVLPQLGLETEKAILQQDVGKNISESFPIQGGDYTLSHGDIVIAAITSCTNTSNPSVLIAAGLVAKAAVELGLTTKPWVKTSFAPGSKAVVNYLSRLDLIKPLEQLGFYVVGFGCTTCIGNSGPLDDEITKALVEEDLVVSSVLSGNRNFEGRIHPLVQLNWLTSPPIVVALAIAGTTKIDLLRDPIGKSKQGRSVYFQELWPAKNQIDEKISVLDREMFIQCYKDVFNGNEHWDALEIDEKSTTYMWQSSSTYIQKPEFFKGFSKNIPVKRDVLQARVLLLLGDSVTTDHISPAGQIKKESPAGRYLETKKVKVADFNSYGSRRGNHEVMIRGTFANVRIHNQINPQIEGGYTTHIESGDILPVYDAAMRYKKENTPLIVMAGKEYGTGSSRDWAAKGTNLLGVKAVIAESFERIHRSNLIGMGVLPCQFIHHSWQSLKLTGKEVFSIIGIEELAEPHQQLQLVIKRNDKKQEVIPLLVRIDTEKELAYFAHGGILPYVLRSLIS